MGARRPWVGVVALVVVAASCAGGASPPSISSSAATTFEQELLADGVVTDAEMERAAFAFEECVRALGIEAKVDIDPEGAGTVTVALSAASEEAVDSVRPQIDTCRAQYLEAAEEAWLLARAPSAREEAEFYGTIAACLRQQGIEVPETDPVTLGRLSDAYPEQYATCLDAALSEG